jgi:hypothetical protein
MKILKFIVVCFTLLTTSQINAASNPQMDDLLNRMAKDSDVQTLITTSSKLIMTNVFVKDLSELSAEGSANYAKVLSEFRESQKNIKLKFPEYASMESAQRKAIIYDLAENATYANYMSCVFTKIGNMLACVGISGSAWAAAKFWLCAGVSATVDIAEEAETGGAATAIIIQEAAAEMQYCLRMASRASLGTITTCAGVLVEQLLANCG